MFGFFQGRPMPKISTKEKLLRVATRMFAENGYKSVTVRDISRASDASISMVAYHYGGKEALYRQVLERQFACYDSIDMLVAHDAPPLEKIRCYVAWSLSKHRENEFFSKLYIRELTSPSKLFGSFVKPLLSRSYNFLFDLVEEGKESGEISRGIDSHAITSVIATSVNYATFYNEVDEKASVFAAKDVDDIARLYMKIFVDGMKSNN